MIRFWDINFYCGLDLRDLDISATLSPQYDEVFNLRLICSRFVQRIATEEIAVGVLGFWQILGVRLD